MKFVQMALVSCIVVGLLATCCWAATGQDQVVPKDAKSAKDVVKQLQQKGTTNIRSVEFNNNQWNVKTQHGQKETQYQINAKTGTVTKQEENPEYENAPPSNVLGILQVIDTVERQGLNGIREVEYDDSLWKVEVVQEGKVTKLCLDPIAGDVIWKDIKPMKSTNADNQQKIDQMKKAIHDRYMKSKSTQNPSGSSNSTQQNWRQNQYQNGSKQSGSSQSGSSTSGSNRYQPWKQQ